MTERKPKHPCPVCQGVGRQKGAYHLASYFRCDDCGQTFTETELPGGMIEVKFRQRIVRSPAECENSGYMAVA